MEMIAMLGGLGAMPELSPAATAARNAIAAAKTVDELAAVYAGLPNMGLPKNEELTLRVMTDQKVRDIVNPVRFYQRPLYWVGVAAVVAAWWHRDKIKEFFRGGLNGLGGPRGRYAPAELQSMSYGGDSIDSRTMRK